MNFAQKTVGRKWLFAAATIGLMTGCVEKENIAHVVDAENILITQAGSVLVSGSDGVMGILPASNESRKTDPLIADSGACNGMAQSGDTVFVVCFKPYIKWKGWTFRAGNDTRLFYAKDTSDPRRMQFELLDDPEPGEGVLDSMILPNGLAVAPDGDLLIANYNLFGQGSLGRVTFTQSGDDLKIAGFERSWLASDYGISNVNGVRVAGNRLYLSDNNKVRRFYFDENAEIPHSVQRPDGQWVSNDAPDNEVYEAGSNLAIIDDLMPYCGGIAFANYLAGQLVYVAENGARYKTAPGSFSFPSSLAVGRGPVFDSQTLLVTEKGVLGNSNLKVGNRLSAVPVDFDLDDPATCDAINTL